jgi:Trk K+ transport system NAD-binding subunit
MEIFWHQHSERLPVVDDLQNRKLIGWISKRDLIGIYSQEILQKRQLTSRFSLGGEDRRRDVLVELPEGFELHRIAVPGNFAGRTLRELAVRSQYNIHIIQIARRDPLSHTTTVEMPGPGSLLREEDELVVIGTVVDIARFTSDMAVAVAKPPSPG